MNTNRRENENFLDWKYRVIEAKLNKETNKSWDEIVDMLGLTCHPGTLRKAAYGIVEAKRHYDKKLKANLSGDLVKDLEERTSELRKERIKLQDYKREFAKFERAEARFEALLEEMTGKMSALPVLEKAKNIEFNAEEKREGLAVFSDWHYGSLIDNAFNTYNTEIARKRIRKLTDKIIQYGKHNNIETLHVAQLGDIISGSIHLTTRLFSDLTTVEQIQEVTEILAQVLSELANTFPNIVYYNIIGNHGRTVAKKEDATIKDNFEYFICWYLRERLKEFDNIEIIEDREGLIATEIMGDKVLLAHGNYEKLGSAEGLHQMFGYMFNQIVFGHYHHNRQLELGLTTELIVNNSLCGVDEYALTIRKASKPAQKFLVYNEEGLENVYNIKL